MFIENKYKRWYDSIIFNAQQRTSVSEYSEVHHIIPRSMGGSDTATNLARLTAREHFICHLLLTKFTSGQYYHKMIYAVNGMLSARDYQERYIPNSHVYESVRKKFREMHSERLSGRTLSEEHKAKISEGGKGRINSLETIEKRRQSCIGKKRTPEQKERMRQAQLNRKQKTVEEKAETARKLSEAAKGRNAGIPLSEETKAKISESRKGKGTGPKSEETKEKMRKPKSAEHKANISKGRLEKYKK